MKQNRGYTLVEMLIILAIIAVMTGMSFVTLGIINQARCTAAAENFNDQVGGLLLKTRAVSNAKETDKPLCMKFVYVKKAGEAADAENKNGTYYLIEGYDNSGTFEAFDPDALDPEAYKADSSKKKQLVSLPNRVTIKYAENKDDTPQLVGENHIIKFRKSDGTVEKGAGYYYFMHGGKTVARVYLDKTTGKHYKK